MPTLTPCVYEGYVDPDPPSCPAVHGVDGEEELLCTLPLRVVFRWTGNPHIASHPESEFVVCGVAVENGSPDTHPYSHQVCGVRSLSKAVDEVAHALQLAETLARVHAHPP
jgi:hypothetical protein